MFAGDEFLPEGEGMKDASEEVGQVGICGRAVSSGSIVEIQ